MSKKESSLGIFESFLLVLLALFSGASGALGLLYLNEYSDYTFFPKKELETSTLLTLPEKDVSEISKETIAENAVITVSEKIQDSVVSIVATKELEYVMRDPFSHMFEDPFFQDFFGDEFQYQKPEIKKEKKEVGAGTGFIITEDGIILTNKHVIADPYAEYTAIFSDGRKYTAKVLTKDPLNDIGMLKITSAAEEFVPVEFIKSVKNIKVGQMVVAIGNALGQFENTVTFGVISAKGREIVAGNGQGTAESLTELLQTDAAINPGNSGGPLVGLDGKVLAMNTAIAANGQGIGFALPLDQQKIDTMLSQIEEYGKIIRPYLGVRYMTITPEINKELGLGSDFGAWIHGENDLPAILPNTPAAKAGLKGGDIILEVNGEKISEKKGLQDILKEKSVGDELTLLILRDGKKEKIQLVLGIREEDQKKQEEEKMKNKGDEENTDEDTNKE